jgi:GT2 family glycosyltransferase
MKIAVLVLNYNGLTYLEQLFESLACLENRDHADVYLVDNASWDQSIAFTKRKYPWVHVIRNEKNFGWGVGYNEAIRSLRCRGLDCYTHYFFLNNDVVVPKESWATLLEAVCDAPANVGEWGLRSLFMQDFFVEDLGRTLGDVSFQFTQAHPHGLVSQLKDDKGSTITIRTQPIRVGNLIYDTQSAVKLIANTDSFCYCVVLKSRSDNEGIEVLLSDDFCVHKVGGNGYSEQYIAYRRAQSSAFEASRLIRAAPPIHRMVLSASSRAVITRIAAPGERLLTLIQNSGSGINGRFEGFDLHCYEPSDTPQSRACVSAVCGVAKLVSRLAYDAADGFDPNYFMYYEDTDFSLTLAKKGFRSEIVDRAVIRHVHSGSSGEHSPFHVRQVSWSLFYFHFKNAPVARRLITLIRFLRNALFESFSFRHEFALPHRLALRQFRIRVGPIFKFIFVGRN